MGKLSGRHILVTGAAGGMGRAIANLFAAEGAALALVDRNGEGAAQAASEIGAKAFRCDVTSYEEVNDVVARAGEALGALDGIVNAAGIVDQKPLEELSPESWERLLAVNLTGPYHIVRAALPALRAAEWATIVNIASTSGLMPMPGTSGYSAAKAGLIMFTRCIGMELGPSIRANAICPGTVETELVRYILDNPEHKARAADRTALKRLGQPQDIAEAALFLSSAEASFVTGAALPVDGGFSWR